MSTKLYVSNLSFSASESDLRGAFEPFGQVTEVAIPTDRETGRPRGFAFVTFAAAESAQAAIAGMNGKELDGRALRVSEARPKEGGAPQSGSGNRNFGPDRKAGAFSARYRDKR
jgi:cold-inducible RNA-binding protein